MRSNAVIVSLSLGVSRNFSAFRNHRIMRNGANEKLHPEKPLTFDWRRQDLKKFRNTTKCIKLLHVRGTSTRRRSRCTDCGFAHVQEIFQTICIVRQNGKTQLIRRTFTTSQPRILTTFVHFRGYLRLNGRFCGPSGLPHLGQSDDSSPQFMPSQLFRITSCR
jgi:hypothetical protein